jgi:chemotaxis protein methyltransferase CheR
MEAAVRPLTQREFSLFRTLVESEAGIHLSEVKQALVNARLLARLRELGLRTFSDYYERVVDNRDDELVRCIDAICTNETQFFREPAQWSLLSNTILPRWREEADAGLRPRRLSVWSAACSTGEEPYSLAMRLSVEVPEFGVRIFATDLSTKALGKAMRAVYPMQRLNDIALELRQRFLLRGVGTQEGKFRVGDEARRLVEFRRLNLTSEIGPELGRFDLLLCRNVLMYFSNETRRAVVGRLIERLAPGGYLWVGHSESLHGFDPRLRTVIPTVYEFCPELA